MLFAVSFVSDIIKSSVIKILTIHSQRVLAHNVLTLTARRGVLKVVLEAGARSCITTATKITSDVSQGCAGAAGYVICTGPRAVEDVAHPHSSGERLFLFHACICRKTQWLKSDGVWGQRKLLWWYVFCCCGHCRLKRLEQRQRWR